MFKKALSDSKESKVLIFSFLGTFCFWGIESIIIPHNILGSTEAAIKACGIIFSMIFFLGFLSGRLLDRYFNERLWGLISGLGFLLTYILFIGGFIYLSLASLTLSSAIINSLRGKCSSILHRDGVAKESIFSRSFVCVNAGAFIGQLLFCGLADIFGVFPSLSLILLTGAIVLIATIFLPTVQSHIEIETKFPIGFFVFTVAASCFFVFMLSVDELAKYAKIFALFLTILFIYNAKLKKESLVGVIKVSLFSLGFYSLFFQLHGSIYNLYTRSDMKISFLPESVLLSLEPAIVVSLGLFFWKNKVVSGDFISSASFLLLGLICFTMGFAWSSLTIVLCGALLFGVAEYLFSPMVSKKISQMSCEPNVGTLYGINTVITSFSGLISASIGSTYMAVSIVGLLSKNVFYYLLCAVFVLLCFSCLFFKKKFIYS